MRRIAILNLVTDDGYFAGPNGGLDFFVLNADFDRAPTRGAAPVESRTFRSGSVILRYALRGSTEAA